MSEHNDFNQKVISEFRANGGKVGGPFEGAPMVVLTTTGAKSGKQHSIPLVYATDGDRMVIFASKAGAPTHPAWYHNLVADPTVTLEVGAEKYQAKASVTMGSERDRLFAAQAARMPNFAEYQRKTTRKIPVVALERLR